MSNQTETYCSDCNEKLPDEWAGSEQDQPCPNCGSPKRTIHLNIHEELGLEFRDRFEAKVKSSTHTGKNKIRREIISGYDKRNSQGDYVHKYRDIDRENDRYVEIIKEEDGSIIHEESEPLSAHWGHGSDKKKNVEA